jgi:hypothetical protein
MAMLPLHALIRIVKLTSKKTQEKGKNVTTAGEIPTNFKIFPAFVTCGTSHWKPSLTIRILGRLTCLFLHGTLLLVALSLRELARLLYCCGPFLFQGRGGLACGRHGPEVLLQTQVAHVSWRFEDCDKTTPDGIPWAAEDVLSS